LRTGVKLAVKVSGEAMMDCGGSCVEQYKYISR
jgi:hypothetical protein